MRRPLTIFPALALAAFFAFGAVPVAAVAAQPAYMVADLTTEIAPNWGEMVYGPILAELDGVGFFFHNDGVHGSELWRTDGTALGTYLLRDLCPGICGAAQLNSIGALATVGGAVFFAASDGVHGVELWLTDGSALGTRPVRDIHPGYGSSEPGSFIAVSGQLYFAADDGVHGRELWRSDGTEKGTYLVADASPGTTSCAPVAIVPADDRLFIGCSAYEAPQGLWVSDGTSAGTVRISDQMLWSRPQFKNRDAIALPGGKLLFAGTETPDFGTELWISDGTAPGTHRLVDLLPGPDSSQPASFVVVDGEVLFTADSDPLHTYRELWKSDGTVAGTVPIPLPATLDPRPGIGLFAVRGDTLYFAGDEAATGLELWKLEGGVASLVKDIRPGPEGSIFPLAGFPFLNGSIFASVSSAVLVLADDGVHGPELWASDGTAAGTVLVSELAPGDARPTLDPYVQFYDSPVLGDRLILRVFDPVLGYRLLASDGSLAGTGYFDSISAGGSSFFPVRSNVVLYESTGPFCFQGFGDRLIFESYQSSPERWVAWGTDGSAAGTQALVDPGATPNFGSEFLSCAALETGVLFGGSSLVESGLWLTRGTPETTSLALGAGAANAPLNSRLRPHLVARGSELLFGAEDSLYRSDGSPDGTILITGLVNYSYGSLGVARDGTIYFSDFELQASDGTPEGTHPVADLNGANASSPSDLTPLGDHEIAFAATDDALGEELWASDGSESGTRLLADIRPGPHGGLSRPFGDFSAEGPPRTFAALDATVVLVADDGPHGAELWVTDGTPLGTGLLRDIYPGDYPSTPRSFARLGARILFSAESELEGRELWATDGTYPGTVLLKDVAPGPASSSPDDLVVQDGVLYFSAWTPGYGREAWKSDGTPAGTVRITDVAPGALSSSPQRFARAGSRLYFSATDQVHGYELWAISDDGSVPLFLDGFENDSTSHWSATVP